MQYFAGLRMFSRGYFRSKDSKYLLLYAIELLLLFSFGEGPEREGCACGTDISVHRKAGFPFSLVEYSDYRMS